ncbi:MAG TPA: DMT family transporter, partial [Candidatus Thermoplasmatota archaeon]|nr:DMT family transporter [Candidatus Thermoplasmatota archaeon]
MRRNLLSGAAIALASAVTFGLVNVVAKSADLHPLALASVAYLLAGAALSPFLLRARFARRDVPLLLTMSLAGGAVAPVLLFAGLLRTTAVDASFLLTAEILFAIVLARTFLGERVGARAGLGIVLLGGAALAVAAATLERGGNAGGDLLGNALVVAATLAWAIDDVVSTRLAGSYAPPQLSSLKGLVGGGAATRTAPPP